MGRWRLSCLESCQRARGRFPQQSVNLIPSSVRILHFPNTSWNTPSIISNFTKSNRRRRVSSELSQITSTYFTVHPHFSHWQQKICATIFGVESNTQYIFQYWRDRDDKYEAITDFSWRLPQKMSTMTASSVTSVNICVAPFLQKWRLKLALCGPKWEEVCSLLHHIAPFSRPTCLVQDYPSSSCESAWLVLTVVPSIASRWRSLLTNIRHLLTEMLCGLRSTHLCKQLGEQLDLQIEWWLGSFIPSVQTFPLTMELEETDNRPTQQEIISYSTCKYLLCVPLSDELSKIQ